MTTPERLRKRQRIEGSALLVLGLLTVIATGYLRGEDAEQRACFARNFAEFGAAIEYRSELDTLASSAHREAISTALRADSPDDVERTRRRYIRQMDAIDAALKRTPLGPLPTGTCEFSD